MKITARAFSPFRARLTFASASAPAWLAIATCLIGFLFATGPHAVAQTTAPAPGKGIEIRGSIEPDTGDTSQTTTVLPRKPKPAAEPSPNAAAKITLEAALTDDGQPVENNLVWRVYRRGATAKAAPIMLRKLRDARPTLNLAPGTYFINAAFGRANLTRRISVLANATTTERFVLNAGGLRARVFIKDGRKPNPRSVSIDIFTDESDQAGQRKRVVSGARPGVVIRLNSGIYHIQSRIGGANAYVSSEVSVEAGKLTEVSVVHQAAPVTFKLVTQPGGEAIAGTRWTILAKNGDVVRESMGALPTHVLAPGRYTVVAQLQDNRYTKVFQVVTGGPVEVEVLAGPETQ